MTKQNLLTRIAGAAGAGIIAFNAIVPALAGFTITIGGNGAGSENEVEFDQETNTTIVQENDVEIENKIDMDANTGDNEIEKNTGGDIELNTGDIDQSAEVTNSAGVNTAVLDSCGCELDLEVVIEKNGADSENEVEIDIETTKELFQENDVEVENKVDVDGDTGDNEVEENTNGDIKLTTGDVDQSVKLSTEAGANGADLGSSEGGATLTVEISENGADSENEVELDFDLETLVVQNNEVEVENDVDLDADTGDNEVEENTGGDIDVETGDVDQTVEVWNEAGVNAIVADVCCDLDGSVTIEKNGADSENEFELWWDVVTEFFQGGEEKEDRHGEDIELETDVDLDGDTGDNEVEKNTGDDLTTGDVDQEVTVGNEAGMNAIGEDAWDLIQALLGILLG